MKAKINRKACTGHGLCVSTCPEIFKMNGNTSKVIIATIPELLEIKCYDAVDGCPSEAIFIED
ncbi:MAG: ferredoxin [bacterium]|nr:ferredoxin [bacterium]